MSNDSKNLEDNPFNPGFGNMPAFLAGRKVEEGKISKTLTSIRKEKLKDGKLIRQSRAPIAIMGPRGVGKTCMLNIANSKATEYGISIIKIDDTHFQNGFYEFINLITSNERSWYEERLSKVSINLFNVLEVEFQSPEKTRALREILITKLEKGPLLIACDEAHMIEDDAFKTFAGIIQEFITDYYPISVIFAGTPSLQRKFTNVKASYLARMAKIKINTLSSDATKEAFLVPFDEKNIKIEDDALNLLENSSDNYPYFTQLIGDKLWDILFSKKINVINIDVAKAAIEESSFERDEFYDERHAEISDLPEFEYLVKIIEFVYTSKKDITSTELTTYIKKNYQDIDCKELINILMDLGAIWRIRGYIKPGIPSFYSHLKKINAI